MDRPDAPSVLARPGVNGHAVDGAAASLPLSSDLGRSLSAPPVPNEHVAAALAAAAVRRVDAASAYSRGKAPVWLIRCADKDACGPPELVPGGRIRAPPVGTREAMLLWGRDCVCDPAAPCGCGHSRTPRNVLIVKKWRDVDARDASVEIADWLVEAFQAVVCVYEDAEEDVRMPARFARFSPVTGGKSAAAAGGGVGPDDVDLIVTVGGDGTVLHTSAMFQKAMPPVVAVAFGSLGFITVHSLASCQAILTRIFTHTPVAEPVNVSIRMRLKVDVYRRGKLAGSDPPEASFVVLNELLLERGPSPYMASLNAYVDDEPLTTVNADGLICATQTGSTAYALSAGGSILSPNTAAISFVPICPHTLSFRPLLFPDSAVLRLEVPLDARCSAFCAFDGRNSMQLNAGDYVTVCSSPWPLPLVCRGTATGDWIRSIKCKLYWNVRERQKGFRAAQAQALEDGAASEDSESSRAALAMRAAVDAEQRLLMETALTPGSRGKRGTAASSAERVGFPTSASAAAAASNDEATGARPEHAPSALPAPVQPRRLGHAPSTGLRRGAGATGVGDLNESDDDEEFWDASDFRQHLRSGGSRGVSPNLRSRPHPSVSRGVSGHSSGDGILPHRGSASDVLERAVAAAEAEERYEARRARAGSRAPDVPTS